MEWAFEYLVIQLHSTTLQYHLHLRIIVMPWGYGRSFVLIRVEFRVGGDQWGGRGWGVKKFLGNFSSPGLQSDNRI